MAPEAEHKAECGSDEWSTMGDDDEENKDPSSDSPEDLAAGASIEWP